MAILSGVTENGLKMIISIVTIIISTGLTRENLLKSTNHTVHLDRQTLNDRVDIKRCSSEQTNQITC